MAPTERRAWIRTVSLEDAEADLLALYQQVLDPESGELDSIMAVHSLNPAGLKAHFELYRVAMSGTPGLRKVDRELVAFVVSQINECHY